MKKDVREIDIERLVSNLVSQGMSLQIGFQQLKFLTGLKKSAIYKRIADGRLPESTNGRYLLVDVVAAIHKKDVKKNNGISKPGGKRFLPDWIKDERKRRQQVGKKDKAVNGMGLQEM